MNYVYIAHVSWMTKMPYVEYAQIVRSDCVT